VTTQLPRDAGNGTSAWRFYPLALIGALGFVILVNVAMAYTAIKTFPGDAVRDAPQQAGGTQVPAP
jgi:nitrogen fixation protein FixH